MAGEWIKMRTNLWDDPRVSQLCDLTSTTEAVVVGGLYWLWSTADEHTETGLLPGMSMGAVDRKTGVPRLAQSLVTIGWLKDTPEGVVIERFEEHNGTSAKTRAQTAKRVAKSRGAGDVTDAPLQSNAPTVTSALAREEKRREEGTTTTSAPEPEIDQPSPSSPQPAAAPADADDVRRCPVGTLVDLYHELMPLNPRVKVLSDVRKKAIRARWKEAAQLTAKPFGYATRTEGLEAWRRFFAVCADSEFLTGRAPAAPGKPPFLADIDFIFSPAGFVKTLENKYHREAA